MTIVLSLLAVQGAIGAFDTLFYHEYKARLPALPGAEPELRLHGARSVLYAVIFGTLPWFAWRGWLSAVLVLIILTEIVITLADFVVEDNVRRRIGGVYPVERVTHAVMGIIYGAMLGHLAPTVWAWSKSPTAMSFEPAPAPPWLTVVLGLMAAGVLASGVRDLVAGFGGTSWPWPRPSPSARVTT